jgi:hypothetical protein
MPVVERSRPAMEKVFVAKIEELVARSHGQIRADKAHGKLVAIGYQGSPRTTRRWVADAKRRWRREHGRLTRPWIPEPGLWMQWDYGDGPKIDGVVTVLFCAWLAWSRFRVVVALRDRTLPSVVLGWIGRCVCLGAVRRTHSPITSGPCRSIMCTGSRFVTRGSWRSPATTG